LKLFIEIGSLYRSLIKYIVENHIKEPAMKTLTLELPEDVELSKARMVIAASLFETGILSSGQAAELVGISRKDFLENVGKQGISLFGETAEDIRKAGGLKL